MSISREEVWLYCPNHRDRLILKDLVGTMCRMGIVDRKFFSAVYISAVYYSSIIMGG